MISRAATWMAMAAAVAGLGASAEAQLTQPVVEVVEIVVDSVTVTEGQLVANTTVTLDIVGRTVTQLVDIPLQLGGSPGPEIGCEILNLAVGPLYLDVLGLVVELDDCHNNPVLVDITAVAGDGQLLGNLLCGVAGLLDSGVDLGEILASLSEDELDLLTGAIAEVLNSVFDALLSNGSATSHSDSAGAVASGPGNHGGHRCDILNLALGPIELDVLGLVVNTSEICLDVYAERGQGNLLGNLLCGVVNLLDNPRSPVGAQLAKIAQIIRLLNRLGL